MIVSAARGAAAALCLASLLSAPARAQLVTAHEDPSAATAAIEFWYRVPASGYDFKAPGIARLALSAAVASHPAGGSSLSEIVNRLGGTLTLEVYPDIAMVGVSVPSSSAASVLRAMANAFFNPAITAAGMKAAAQDSAVVAAQQPFDSSRTLQDALFAQIFSAGPAHYAPLPDPSAFATLTQGDAQAFAARAFQRSNTIVSLAGNIVPSAVAAITGSGSTLADAPFDSTAAGVPPDASVSARVAGLGLGWKGPAISDTRAATAMDFVADYLFDPDRGTVVRAARGARGLFVNGQFVTLHDPGVLLVTLSGESAGTFQQTVLDAVAGLQTPLDPVAFAGARKAFLYHILSQIQTPAARADNQGWYAAEGNAAYAPGDSSGVYLNAVNSLDPQFVAQTVRAYLQKPVIVRLIQSSPGGSAT